MAESKEEEKDVPDAKVVYVLMKNEYRISRNIRAQWFLQNLNKTVEIKPVISENDCTEEIQIISAIPNSLGSSKSGGYAEHTTYRIVPSTRVAFLATRYRLAFCLDLGPSVSTVDIQHGSILFDEIYSALERSLEFVSQPFFIPNSQFLFRPQVHITIIAHIPLCPTGVPQVLIQGWVLTARNLDSLRVQLQKNLAEISESVAQAAFRTNERSSKLKLSEKLSTSYNDPRDSNRLLNSSIQISTADISTVNLFRYGILALQLLPENSSAGIVIITDGILSFPNTQTLDKILTQLRNCTVACSFLQIGSPYHPFTCFGFVPYKELMQFIAAATCGAYFPSYKDFKLKKEPLEMNPYHQAFLVWDFQNIQIPEYLEGSNFSSGELEYWSVRNEHFYSVAGQSRVQKKNTEGNIKVSLESLLSCRLREGYTVKSVNFNKSDRSVEVRLLLPWKPSINIEYVITGSSSSAIQRKTEVQPPSCHFEVIVDGCYEFLHDVNCADKKPINSPYRSSVISQYWSYLKNLSHTDQILVQLHSFSHNPVYYTIPESMKNGMPLFCLNATTPEIFNKNAAPSQFTSFWKPLCMLDINVWQKWMHAHRIGVILQHDMPLPKNLHMPNSSGRYVHILCRQATSALNSLLTEYCSFVLVENHSYIKLLFNEADKPPISFFVIRVTSKAPCMVIRLAFLGGMPGYKRNEVVKDIRDKILNLKLPKRGASKDPSPKVLDPKNQNSASFDTLCCFLLKKPVEKILIRYDRLPSNFSTLFPENQVDMKRNYISHPFAEHQAANLMITLSRYLHHHRWIWTMQCGPNRSLELSTVSKILSTLTKIRLREGFHFSHSSFGIIYMVIEMPMKIPPACFESEESENIAKDDYPCVVQYLLFPPHTNTTFKDSISEEEDIESPEADGELQLITECWVEPQYGKISSSELKHLNGLSYKEISQAIYSKDLECVSVLTTFEHLCMMCQRKGASCLSQETSPIEVAKDFCMSENPPVLPPPQNSQIQSPLSPTSPYPDTSISLVPYAFNLVRMLCLCHQTEIMFSSFFQGEVSRMLDEAVEISSRPNDLFFEYLLSNVKLYHDRELVLSIQDCMAFVHQVSQRQRDPVIAPKLPFMLPEMTDVEISVPEKHSAKMDCYGSKVHQVLSGQKESSNKSLLERMNIVERNIPRWRCFVRGVSSSHFICTMIPATFNDLEKLIGSNIPETGNFQQMSRSYSSLPESLNVDENSTKHIQNSSHSPRLGESFEMSYISEQESPSALKVPNQLSFPVYIYDCAMSSVTSSLIYREEKSSFIDSYKDHTFKLDETTPNTEQPQRRSSIRVEDFYREDKKCADPALLRRQVSLMNKAYCKAFVYGVYRSLMLGLDVNKLDVEAAIDGICEETLLEIDITGFVYMLCGHVKDFNVKHSVKHEHVDFGKLYSEKNDADDDYFRAAGTNLIQEKSHLNCFFPLSLLQKHQPCEQLQQKHADIKSKFSEILEDFFKRIPSHPDYYFFCPSRDEEEKEASVVENEDFSENQNEDTETKYANSCAGEEVFDTESLRDSNLGIPEDEASMGSHVNTQSSLSSLEHDADTSMPQQSKEFSPPLFVHLSCSVRTKHDIKSCPLTSLPTCLGDMITCIDSGGDVDLDKLRITLDLTCLSLPYDIESPAVSPHRQYSTSFSSSSPVPETDRCKNNFDEDDIESISSDFPTDTVKGGALIHLPVCQYEAVHKCIDKVHWLLQDEMAAAALDSYPITSSLLKMVADHVSNSNESTCCTTKEVPLQFVFGPDMSLDKFIQAFKRMSPPGYHLSESDGTYYLVLDAESVEKLNKPFGSLDPPLGIVAKYNIVQRNPHRDDNTELKSISDETGRSLAFANKDNIMYLRENLNLQQIVDNAKNSELSVLGKSSFNNKSTFSLVGKRSYAANQEDDTETEDSNYRLEMKFKSGRKTTTKFFREKSRVRTCSLPSHDPDTRLPHHRARGSQSLPRYFVYGITGDKVLPTNQSSKEKYQGKKASCSSGDKMNVSRTPQDFKGAVQLSPEQSIESGSEVSAFLPFGETSPSWDTSSVSKGEVQLVTSSGSIPIKHRPTESVGSPVVYSEVDLASVIGSGQFSNTEDGYDGDSSDTDSDLDWLNALDTRRPVLPKFWLIMTVSKTKVLVHFHIRHRKTEDEELTQSKAILSTVINIINDICKEVNQTLLLQDLHETRMCNQLLVPEASDDIWRRNGSDPILAISDTSGKLSREEQNSLSEVHEKYLEANLNFMPGTFDCAVVWVVHFPLHPRLTSGTTGPAGKSRGIPALRTVLNSFSVNNRKNMFVYQERSGSVFYLRLHEVTCDENHAFGKFRAEDNISLSGSSISGVQTFHQKKTYSESEMEPFRPRLNSGHSDVDHQDTASTISGSTISKKPQQCIALFVHGTGNVGTEIKEDLVHVLQKKLNESILDVITVMLSRNPRCKLSPEDVQFIQSSCSAPTTQLHFTVPLKLLHHAHSLHIYLRQNMLHFLHNPKYTDSRKESHFKAYVNGSGEWMQVDDNDIFLYNCTQASGFSGSKGIACIVLSLVTGQGQPFQHLGSCPPPNPSEYQDGLSENDYEELTCTSLYSIKPDRLPGPVLLVRFQIWSVGKISMEQLEKSLKNAICHSLWDILMEYRLLTAPVTVAVIQSSDEFSCFSEPTTPIRVRKTGRTVVDPNFQLKELSSVSTLLSSKEMSSSVPDIAAKDQPSLSSLHDSTIFKFNSQSQVVIAEPQSEVRGQGSHVSNISNFHIEDPSKKNLNYTFHSVIKSFLHHGANIGCPTLSRHIFTLSSRHSIVIILKEIQSIVRLLNRDLFADIFLRVTDAMSADTEFVPFIPAYAANPGLNSSSEEYEEIRPGTTRNFIVIARNVKQWKAYMGLENFVKFHEPSCESLKRYQKYQTHLCCPSVIEKVQDSTPASPTSVSRSNFGLDTPSPNIKCPGYRLPEVTISSPSPGSVSFVPRQNLLLMYLQDKELTVYVYNWAQEIKNNLIKQLEKLIQWHYNRDSLVTCIVSQKLGLFHIQNFPCQPIKQEKQDKSEVSKRSKEDNVHLTWNLVDQLVHQHNHPNSKTSSDSFTSQSSRTSPANPRVSLIFETLRNTRPPVPLHQSHYSTVKDPVMKYGLQLQDTHRAQRRDMQELHLMWQTKSKSLNNPSIDRWLKLLKRVCRLSHYCLTPILFSPSWRWKVAPIRDHTVEPLDLLPSSAPEKSSSESSIHSRSRHNSGSSIKNTECASGGSGASRSRRVSGASCPSSGQSSPKPRRNPSEEAWHFTVCSHYLQEYVQYLHTLGFVSVQNRSNPRMQSGKKSVGNEEEAKPSSTSRSASTAGSVPYSRSNMWGPPVYLMKNLLNSLLLFEIGLSDPYAYAHLYAIERSRLHLAVSRTCSSQFTTAFLDELDKIKSMMNLHSFTFDYHLRTIHSYISGRQLIFRQGYHLTSFLDDFIKYYQKSPNCARNLLHAGSLTLTDIHMHGHQLYNYIISHNQLYGMNVLRMVPIIQDSSSMMDTEYVLVELSAQKTSYKDNNDVCQMGSFDIGLLINHNTSESVDKNTLVLNYYIILTSQRELYPKLSNFGAAIGSFQTVRFGSTQSVNSGCFSSRKTSSVSLINERDLTESSEEESSSLYADTRSKLTSVRGMCDEDVMYLGYFSNQETMMQQVLMSQAESAQSHLRAVVCRAAVHCRRDFLWNSLLPHSAKERSSNKDGQGPVLSYAEFSELLNLVTLMTLDDLDPNLTPLLNMHISWYQGLSLVLKTKHSDSCREFISPDGNTHYVVLTHIRCPDSFMLLSIDVHSRRADLCLVVREPSMDMEHTPEKPNQRILALQSLTEDFVNACCFHLWSGLLC